MTINRRRFLALPAIGVPAMLVGERLGLLAWVKSYFPALRGGPLTAESIPEPARLGRALHDSAVQSMICIALQLDVLQRQALAQANPLASDLERLSGLMLKEAQSLALSPDFLPR